MLGIYVHDTTSGCPHLTFKMIPVPEIESNVNDLSFILGYILNLHMMNYNNNKM